MDFNPAISGRTTGQYPLSVGTSLAIESAVGIHPEIKVTRAPILEVKQFWINISTLHRNLIASIDRMSANLLDERDIAGTLHEEMKIITDVVHQATNFKVTPFFYASQYQGLEQYKHALLRRPTTELQKQFDNTWKKSIRLLVDHYQKEFPLTIFQNKLKSKHHQEPSTMIFTHYTYDLLSYPIFERLILLESHIGKVKERPQWYTRYYNGQELSMIPFSLFFLELFGDSTLFRPFPIKVRKEIIELAKAKNWSSITTKEKISSNLDSLRDPFLRVILKEMLADK